MASTLQRAAASDQESRSTDFLSVQVPALAERCAGAGTRQLDGAPDMLAVWQTLRMDEDFCLRTSIRLEARQCHLLQFHLDRFAAGAKAFDFALDLAALEQALTTAAAEYIQQSPAKLRVTVARNGSWRLDTPQPLAQSSDACVAMLWPDAVNSDDPLLPFSTTYRPHYDEALHRAKSVGLLDAIFTNERGLVTEGADHSIFVRHGSRWRTPTLAAGVLPGVYRRHLLETMPDVLEEDFREDRLFDADEIWLTNAVYGVRRVTLVNYR